MNPTAINQAGDDTGRSLRVRPYVVTGGRTRSQVDLGIETIVRSSERRFPARFPTAEYRRVLAVLQTPQSVAEVAAHVGLPIQVVKVLIGDLIGGGFATVHSATTRGPGERPDLVLLERVLDGLHNL